MNKYIIIILVITSSICNAQDYVDELVEKNDSLKTVYELRRAVYFDFTSEKEINFIKKYEKIQKELLIEFRDITSDRLEYGSINTFMYVDFKNKLIRRMLENLELFTINDTIDEYISMGKIPKEIPKIEL